MTKDEITKTMPLKVREITVQVLYSWAIAPFDDQEMLDFMMKTALVSRTNARSAIESAKHVWSNIEQLDSYIEVGSEDYALDRISKIDHAILRLMAYEMIFEKLPIQVVIAEGIRLSNKFSLPQAGSFVHAILDAVYKETVSDKALV